MQIIILDKMNNQQSFKLSLAASHHVESFNFIYEQGLTKILHYLQPMQLHEKDLSPDITQNKNQFNLPFKYIKLSISHLQIGKPFRCNDPTVLYQEILPQECRLSNKTYTAPLLCQISRQIDGASDSIKVSLGQIPIMVRSKNCHLADLSEQQLIKMNEDPNQFGGYFIVNGNQKIVRMLVVQKSNYPVAFLRPSYTNRGPGYTQYAVQMRCVRQDFYARTFTLHYLSDGNIHLRILYRKQQFLIPLIVIIKAIGNYSDRQIYTQLMKGRYQNSSLSDKIQVVIKTAKNLCLYTQNQFLQYLGRNFRLLLGVSSIYSDKQAGQIFLSQNICPHLSQSDHKFQTLCLMVEKLYALVDGQIKPENLDCMAIHEVLLPGHLYLMILRQKLQDSLSYIRSKMMKDSYTNNFMKIRQAEYIVKNLQTGAIGKQIQFFLATGNLKSRTGLDLMQDKGFAVIADKLNNMRFLSHFRSIHRGAYFAEMKTTTVRKLLPQSWGFLCPVHTPDGAPCGLLNHITISCCPLTKQVFDSKKHRSLEEICRQHGMIDFSDFNYLDPVHSYPVMINGRLAGYVDNSLVEAFIDSMRHLKCEGKHIPKQTQIAFLKKGNFKNTVFPMIFITTGPSRFLRPVKNLGFDSIEWISPLQQLFLDIDLPEGTHSQLSSTNILSILPQHIPFLNYNQSPRNMYQCQMAKQTMGTAVLNWDYRYDNKMYRILHSQMPLVRTKLYNDLKFNDYNSGTNAVVAVISYTGYDMQDAMVINKSSYQNGLGHGVVYKTVEYTLTKDDNTNSKKPPKFKLFKDSPLNLQQSFEMPKGLDSDGMVKVGAKLKKLCPILVLYETSKNSFKTFYNKQSESCYVQGIIISSGDNKNTQRVAVKLRFDRRPVIGDKFSSRHGQKGVLSMLWPKIDMPFTQTGMTPDIIINPNAFPSRMTIGMLIESMAAKSAALQGKAFQYQVFQPYQNDDVIDYFGQKLMGHGFNYHGNQTMYSGISGTQLKVDIYIGLVYYQRLRHMVHDKSQARSTGPVDILTQQPLKGRKKGGGIRMGEMQRDAMLAHGLSQIVNERLYRSSDKSQAFICNKCGSMLSCYKKMEKISGQSLQQVYKQSTICKGCNSNDCSLVGIPYVMKYLINQLAAMNIKIKFKLKL